MLNVFAITGPLFTLIFLGYLAVKTNLLPASLLPGIARFVLYFCVPGVILSNFLRSEQHPVFEPEFLKLYAIIGLLTLALGFIINVLLKRESAHASIFALGGALPNSMFVGFPVLLQATPEIAVQVLVMCILVENVIVMPISLLLADISSASGDSLNQRLQQIGKRMINNPMLISVVLGLGLSSMDIYAPAFLQTTLDMLAKAAAPAALVFIGGALVGHQVKGDMTAILTTAFSKLILMPLIALAVLAFSAPLPGQLGIALVLIAASPMFSIYAIIASNYGVGKAAASIQVFTTGASFITLNAFLAYLLH